MKIYRIINGLNDQVLRSYRGRTVYDTLSGAKTALASHRKRHMSAIIQECVPDWKDMPDV